MPDKLMALQLVKTRLNRAQADTTLDEYLAARIDAAEGELKKTGITLTDSPEDMMWDKSAGMPEWLRQRRRDRWLQQKRGDNA